MQTGISQITKEAFEVQPSAFTELVNEATKALSKEDGRVGNLDILGRLVRLRPSGEALIIGDLHGDLESLVDILMKSEFLRKLKQTSSATLIFLGDYGDRGPLSVEVYYTVLSLKLLFPEQVVLMRGNHEGPDDLLVSPHDLPTQFQTRFGREWIEAYKGIRELFALLHNAVLVEERYLLVHGGLPKQTRTTKDLAYAHIEHPRLRLLEDMLWSDPSEMVEDTCASPRGAGRLFGERITRRVLERLGVKVLIRGHEPCSEGFKTDHNGKVLTIFSRKGPPYFNAFGAYLDLELTTRVENANQLIPFVHKF